MSFRFWMIVIGIIGMAILNAYIINVEHIEVRSKQEIARTFEDKLADITYSSNKDIREQNLAQFGFDDKMILMARKQFKYLKRYETQIKSQIEGAEDLELLTEIFCPRDSKKSVRPRYAAVQVLLKEENGKRVVYNPKFDSELVFQEWVGKLSLVDIYANVEKVEKVPAKSTVMVIAAFLTDNDDALIRRLRPWGSDVDGSWDWDDVLEKDADLEENIVQYICLMHVMTEIANDDNGICGQSSE